MVHGLRCLEVRRFEKFYCNQVVFPIIVKCKPTSLVKNDNYPHPAASTYFCGVLVPSTRVQLLQVPKGHSTFVLIYRHVT